MDVAQPPALETWLWSLGHRHGPRGGGGKAVTPIMDILSLVETTRLPAHLHSGFVLSRCGVPCCCMGTPGGQAPPPCRAGQHRPPGAVTHAWSLQGPFLPGPRPCVRSLLHPSLGSCTQALGAGPAGASPGAARCQAGPASFLPGPLLSPGPHWALRTRPFLWLFFLFLSAVASDALRERQG